MNTQTLDKFCVAQPYVFNKRFSSNFRVNAEMIVIFLKSLQKDIISSFDKSRCTYVTMAILFPVKTHEVTCNDIIQMASLLIQV